MSDTTFDYVLNEVDSFSYDQCVILLSKLTDAFSKKGNDVVVHENSPIDKFFGSVDEEDSEKMLTAVQDCGNSFGEQNANRYTGLPF